MNPVKPIIMLLAVLILMLAVFETGQPTNIHVWLILGMFVFFLASFFIRSLLKWSLLIGLAFVIFSSIQ